MKIGLISDTHNNENGVADVLQTFRQENVTEIIHCGDMTSGATMELFTDFCIHHVWGNGDLDTFSYQMIAQECKPGSSSAQVFTGLFDGKKVAAVHGHRMSELYSLEDRGDLDFVFHGHTHRQEDMMRGRTRVINPGAVGGAYRGRRGFAIVDFSTGDVTFFDL